MSSEVAVKVNVVEFLKARIDEDERTVLHMDCVCEDGTAQRPDCPDRIVGECEAKRRIIEWHESWPVLVETAPVLEQSSPDDISSMSLRMSQEIAWLTEQEYRKRFGNEPPTSPILLMLAAPYSDHDDFDPTWGVQ